MSQNRLAHQVVADRYELLETVGRGGFGVVWRACDTLLQRHVAVKEIHIPGFLNEEDRAGLREKVLKEARAAARLDHPGAVTVFDVIDDDGHPVIVMELVDAPNLAELVAERGPLEPDEAARIGLEVLEVLDAAHARGIVHRDVKPGNVMVDRGSGRVRLGDFGVAAILDDPTVTASESVTGSPAYIGARAGHQQGRHPRVRPVVAGRHHVLRGRGAAALRQGGAAADVDLDRPGSPRPAERAGPLGPVLDALLVKDPHSRLTAAQLRDRLAEVASGVPVVTAVEATRPDDTMVIELDEPPAPPRAEPVVAARLAPTHSNPTGWVVAAVVAVLMVALIAVALGSRDSDPPPETAGGSPSTTAEASGGGTPASTAAPSRSRTAPTPSNTVTYTDPQTGFTIAKPADWSVRTDGTRTDFRDPVSGAYLRVDHISPPGPSPEGAWYELETSFAAEHENYQRIRIEPTTYSGYRAAIWEFTYTSGAAELRVANLGFITPRYGFALYVQTRAGDWDRLQPTFQALKDSFKAPA